MKIRAKWRDYRYCRIKVDKIEVARFISDYDYVVEKEFIKPTTELQQEFAERVSKIHYTLKKIDTEGGQDKFILVFYNEGKYDVDCMTMKIDNIRFYQRCLSDSEIEEIYESEN